MDQFLHLPPTTRAQLCEEASARRGISAAAIEKDLWICWILRELFSLPAIGEHLTFKGGTSLSKGWGLIDRFSEDIDVVVDRGLFGYPGDDLSKGQLKKLRDRCQKWIAAELLPALCTKATERLGENGDWALQLAGTEENQDRETVHFEYARVELPSSGYLRPVVRIECGARSEPEPVEVPQISPYLFEEFPDLLGSGAFSVRTVSPRRTFLDKAMLLHEEGLRPSDRQRPHRLSRHYYDLWCLITRGVADQALADPGLFESVARHRERFWAQSGVDYSTLRQGQLRLVPGPEQLAGWRKDYLSMQEMIFGEAPDFAEIMATVGQFESRFNAGPEAH